MDQIEGQPGLKIEGQPIEGHPVAEKPELTLKYFKQFEENLNKLLTQQFSQLNASLGNIEKRVYNLEKQVVTINTKFEERKILSEDSGEYVMILDKYVIKRSELKEAIFDGANIKVYMKNNGAVYTTWCNTADHATKHLKDILQKINYKPPTSNPFTQASTC